MASTGGRQASLKDSWTGSALEYPLAWQCCTFHTSGRLYSIHDRWIRFCILIRSFRFVELAVLLEASMNVHRIDIIPSKYISWIREESLCLGKIIGRKLCIFLNVKEHVTRKSGEIHRKNRNKCKYYASYPAHVTSCKYILQIYGEHFYVGKNISKARLW